LLSFFVGVTYAPPSAACKQPFFSRSCRAILRYYAALAPRMPQSDAPCRFLFLSVLTPFSLKHYVQRDRVALFLLFLYPRFTPFAMFFAWPAVQCASLCLRNFFLAAFCFMFGPIDILSGCSSFYFLSVIPLARTSQSSPRLSRARWIISCDSPIFLTLRFFSPFVTITNCLGLPASYLLVLDPLPLCYLAVAQLPLTFFSVPLNIETIPPLVLCSPLLFFSRSVFLSF